MHKTRLTRVVGVTAALAAVASIAVLSGSASAALPPNTLPTPGQTLSVNAGTEATSFALGVTAPNNACPGDTASGGFQWNQYIVSRGVDASQLTWSAGQPVAPVGQYAQVMYSAVGSPQANRNTAVTTGNITGTAVLSFANNTGLTNGQYKIGFSCTKAGVTERYWQTPITISNVSGTSLNYALGWTPDAPTGVSVTNGDGTVSVAFIPPAAAATPSILDYRVTATPQGGGAVITATGAGSPIAVPGLTNGTVYDITVAAQNSLGFGPESSPTVAGSPNLPGLPGVTGLSVAASPTDARDAVLTWTNPATPGQTGATITVNPSVPGSPFSTVGSETTFTVNDLDPGDYTFTVTPTYGPLVLNPVASATTGTFTVFDGAVVIQDITVVRPLGALVLTQRCGVYGSAAAYTDDVFGTLPALPASPANADPDPVTGYAYGGLPTGTIPTGENGGAESFDEYPYPVLDATQVPNPSYPTHCGIDLGIGTLVTSGPRAGQYFAADGRIAQLTVVNTQNIDGGWTLNGQMSNFVKTGEPSEFFSGNLLGWDPEVTFDSSANLDGYDMVVNTGGVRQPAATSSTTGLGAASNSTNTTLAQSLAKSDAGASLGMSVHDARLRLLIPVAADAGTYTGTLTFTTV